MRARGVLGINARNADYILLHNERRHYARVDDKIVTKGFAKRAGVAVPTTYAVIERQGDVRRFASLVENHPEFVLKPARGAAGRGIMVVTGHDGRDFTSASGESQPLGDVQAHISTTLSGLYSLGGRFDRVLVEQRIERHPVFAPVVYRGTPDVRIVLYRGVPVMAMTRLPTKESRGRANLHQGAIAAAIDLATGVTSGGVRKNRTVSHHPDTNEPIRGFAIPFWDTILEGAQRLAEHLELGYIGVDYVVDANLGPVVLEANARPGLSIQVANQRGLLPRLEFVDKNLRDDGDRAGLIAGIAAL